MEKLIGLKLNTLVVGQDVYMVSGLYVCWGTVIEVTSSLVVVLVMEGGGNGCHNGEPLRFDNTGKGLEDGTHEFGPWYLDDNPFVETTARHEQKARMIEWALKEGSSFVVGAPSKEMMEFAEKHRG